MEPEPAAVYTGRAPDYNESEELYIVPLFPLDASAMALSNPDRNHREEPAKYYVGKNQYLSPVGRFGPDCYDDNCNGDGEQEHKVRFSQVVPPHRIPAINNQSRRPLKIHA